MPEDGRWDLTRRLKGECICSPIFIKNIPVSFDFKTT
jgi:hypothetical protein